MSLMLSDYQQSGVETRHIPLKIHNVILTWIKKGGQTHFPLPSPQEVQWYQPY